MSSRSGAQAGPDRWFKKDAAFDDEIRRALPRHPRSGRRRQTDRLGSKAREGALALLILLDQFPRNMFRGDARAFATDPLARAVTAGAHRPRLRQRRCRRTCAAFSICRSSIRKTSPTRNAASRFYKATGDADGLKWAEIHADIIRRFGRFPHRNAVLGRATTPEEQAFLDGGGFARAEKCQNKTTGRCPPALLDLLPTKSRPTSRLNAREATHVAFRKGASALDDDRQFFSCSRSRIRRLARATERGRRRHRYRRHCHQRERPGSGRLGDRRNHRTADQICADRRHRRPGPLPDSRPADGELQRLGARLRPGRLAQDARQTRHNARSHGGARAERSGGGALLPGDLLVHADEDSAGERVRRQERHPREAHAERLAEADEQCRLHRLPSARPGIDPHDPGRARQLQFRRGSLDAAHRNQASPASR